MEATKTNFRELLADQISGSSDDVEFCIKFAEEHQAKGWSDGDIMPEIVKILAMDSNRQRNREIIRHNQAVADGINSLARMNSWTNLSRISQHALEAEIECLESEPEKPFFRLVDGNKIRLAVLMMGSDEFVNVFTPEFLAKHKWTGK